MPIDRFLTIIALTLNFFGLVFVVIGTFRLIRSDPKVGLAEAPYPPGFSLDRLRSLSRQKGYTVCGIILMSMALLFHAAPLVLIPEPWEILSGYDQIALTLAPCLGILLVVVVFRRTLSVCRRTEEKGKRAVMKDRLVRALHQNPLRRTHWNSLVEDAETLLGIPPRSKNEPIDVFLRKLARELGVDLPAALQIEDE
jgi:hypothetical protein